MTAEQNIAGIVWIAPEVMFRDERAKVVAQHKGDADALIAKLDDLDRSASGEYRRIVDCENDDPSFGSATRVEDNSLVEEYEDDRYVWVDDAPGDGANTAGHFEKYDPETHGAPYAPVISRPEGN